MAHMRGVLVETVTSGRKVRLAWTNMDAEGRYTHCGQAAFPQFHRLQQKRGFLDLSLRGLHQG